LAAPSCRRNRGRLEKRLDRFGVLILEIGTTVNNAVRLLPLSPEIDPEPPRLYAGLSMAVLIRCGIDRSRWCGHRHRRHPDLVFSVDLPARRLSLISSYFTDSGELKLYFADELGAMQFRSQAS
jgi:hypothetical protein